MNTDNTQAAIDAGKAIGKLETAGTIHVAEPGGYPFIITPAGEAKGVEQFLFQPIAVRAAVSLHDAKSFNDYVNRFKDDAATLVFADLAKRSFTAVLDYHGVDTPSWGKHRATFACEPTDAWKAWTAHDKQPKSQVEFARLIEDGIPDIADPAGATLLAMVLTLEEKKDVAFRSSVRLQNGQHQLKYEETINAGAQVGTLTIPNSFTLALEPFQGVGRRGVDARFRYRMKDGVLSMWYELVRPDDVLRAAFDEIASQIAAGSSAVPMLAGVAPVLA